MRNYYLDIFFNRLNHFLLHDMTDTDYNVIDIQEILEEKYKADETNIKVTYSKNSILKNLIYIKLYLLGMSLLTSKKLLVHKKLETKNGMV